MLRSASLKKCTKIDIKDDLISNHVSSRNFHFKEPEYDSIKTKKVTLLTNISLVLITIGCFILYSTRCSTGTASRKSSVKLLLGENMRSSPASGDLYWRGMDVSDPIMGARHPNGTRGMIVDPSPDRLLPFYEINFRGNKNSNPLISRDSRCPQNRDFGIEGEGGHKVLQRIKKGIKNSKELTRLQEEAIAKQRSSIPSSDTTSTLNVIIEPDATSTDTSGTSIVRARKSRILCMVYTVHLPPYYSNLRLKAQASTWGKQCDGFIAASNYTDHTVGAINLEHLGPEAYSNMWQKVRSMWAYAYHHYRDEYDFFQICGDDVYLAIDNLRAFVDGPQVMRLENGYVDAITADQRSRRIKVKDPATIPRPLIFGTPMIWKRCWAPAGGPGYMLNRAALVTWGEESFKTFEPHTIDHREDLFMGGSLCENLGIHLSDTRDNKAGFRYNEDADQSYKFEGKFSPRQWEFMKSRGLDYNDGIDSVSPQTIGLHLKSELWTESMYNARPKRKRLGPRSKFGEKQLELKKFRIEMGLNFTETDLMYRYHAVLHGLCD